MKKVLILLVLLLAAIAVWYFVFTRKSSDPAGPKQQPITVSKHSEEFNRSMQKLLDAYYNMTEAFVNWDTININKYSNELKFALDSVKMDEIKKDSTIYETAITFQDNSKAELDGLMKDPSLDEKRASLNMLSDNLFNFLRTIRYDKGKVYWQECPMAFGDDKPGFWLSGSDAVRNPYLGMHHPKYGKGMLTCGGPKDTLNFMVPDTIKK